MIVFDMRQDSTKPLRSSENLHGIEPIEEKWLRHARSHLDSLTKPIGSLGTLEEIAARVVAIQQSPSPCVDRKAIFVFAADHGVTEEGVSAYPSAVTQQMVMNFLDGGAAINVLASAAQAEISIVDVGVNGDLHHAGLLARKIGRGTKNFVREPAMSFDETAAALQVGKELAEAAHSCGRQMVAVGEMGIGNTTAASVITAALTGRTAEQVTGGGTGVTGSTFVRKQQIVQAALALHFPDYRQERQEALDILRCVGGLEIAAICGFILAAARLRMAVVIDGFISTAAAAIACLIEPAARDYLFAGHLSREIGHGLLLELLGLQPLLQLRMRLGEGTGAVLAFNIIDAAVRLYNEMATFQSARVSGAIGQ